jgi:Family of unknown function (DUF5906)/RepB DNA-primase from phage plasmid
MAHPLSDFTLKTTLAEGLHIDIKTHSVCDPRKVDPRPYSENWSTGVWVAGYAIGCDDVKLWHPGDAVPPELTRAIASGLPIISHDVPFKRALFINIMGPRYGWPIPPLEQWVCTAAMAATMSFSRSLDDAARALGLGLREDKEGHALRRRMARPRSKTRVRCIACGKMACEDHEMFNTSLVWWSGAEDRACLDSYCVQDVRTGRALCDVLRPLSQSEHEIWLRDQVIYEHSMALDTQFADGTTRIPGEPAVTTNLRPQGAPEIVPDGIRGHVGLIHMLAKSFAGRGTIVATGFGEDPNEIDQKTGNPGLQLPPKVIHASIGGVKETLTGLAQFLKRPHYNVYMPLAIFRPDLSSWAKGFERDVVACLGIVADFDDSDATRWAERLPIPPNYVLETSAGRFQAFYLFDKPEAPEVVKSVAERLKAFAGCDHGTSDISHVWRVGGALNWPNAKKVAEGRARDPQLVRVVKFDGGTTSLQALSAVLPQSHAKAGPKGKSLTSSTGSQPHDQPPPIAMKLLPSELQEEIKRAVPHGDRSEALFRVIAKMIEEGLDDKTIETIIRAHPTGIGEKHADRDDLDRDIARVREKTAVSSPDDKITSLVSEMNKKYAVVDDDGKTVIVYRREDTELNRKYVVRATYQDFRNLYLNARVPATSPSSGRPKVMTHADVWLGHPQRKTYKGGLRFLPGVHDGQSDVYNLWTGWGIDPQAGDWSEMKAHIKNILCSGVPEHFDYVMNWQARAVQKPSEPGEVALVLRGARGTGKGIFARTIGALFGQHFLHLSDARHLTGNFNAHLRDACLVFADEAFYAGDKQHEGQLKRLVTEPTLMIEAKYANPVSVRNCLHLIVASNDDWVVPAGTDERRFFVLDVSSARQKDYEYFGFLKKELEGGGAAAMLHELLHRDLSGFNVRDVPQTSGLLDQKVRSLRGFEAWWYEILADGRCPGAVCDGGVLAAEVDDWANLVKVDRNLLYDNYEGFSKAKNQYRPEDKSRLGKFLRRYVPGLDEERPRQTGNLHRDRLYLLPPLNECRAGFEKVIGPIEWGNT